MTIHQGPTSQLDDLAALRRNHRSGAAPRSSRLYNRAIEWARVIESDSRRADLPHPLKCFLDDFFTFFLNVPKGLDRLLRQHVYPGSEPLRASDETHADLLWQLSGLVQDAWEHACGPLAELNAGIQQVLADCCRSPVYDFGAGAGYFAFSLAAAGFDVTCVEANIVKRAFLRHRNARNADKISLRRVHPQYHSVVAIDVLDHMADPVAAIGALVKRLSRDGRLLCQATFADDGWHTGGAEQQQLVHRCLSSHFARFSDDPRAPTVLVTVGKRDLPVEPEPIPTILARDRTRVRLDAGTLWQQIDDGQGDFALHAPTRFYARPLRVSRAGLSLAKRCAAPCTSGELIADLSQQGFARVEVLDALEQLAEHGLLMVDPAPGPPAPAS